MSGRRYTLAPRWRGVLAVLAALVLLPGSGLWAAQHQYTVAIDERLQRLQVTICPQLPVGNGATALVLRAASARFADYVRNLERVDPAGNTQPLQLIDGELPLAGHLAGSCVRYQLDVGRAATVSGRDEVTRLGSDLLASPDLWLLQPALGAEDTLLVQFHLPAGIRVSAPWQPLGGQRYRISASPGGWRPLVAFGRFEEQALLLPGGGRLRLAVLDGRPPLDVAATAAWVQAAACQVSGVYGRFPVDNPQVLVTPVLGSAAFGATARRLRGSPVPFARVLRNGGVAAQFFVNQAAAVDAFAHDWTATHEFSHMLLPYIDRQDAWLSEGFASYYQNVLRARAGVLSEQAGWEQLQAGFRRGSRQPYRDTLAESIALRGPNMIMRMYWSGAAIALLADTRLRLAAGTSLDEVLERLQRCCLAEQRTWSGRELFARLDELAAEPVFVELYERWVHAVSFPDYLTAYRQLGISAAGDRLQLDDDHPGAEVRRAIMAPRPEAPRPEAPRPEAPRPEAPRPEAPPPATS